MKNSVRGGRRTIKWHNRKVNEFNACRTMNHHYYHMDFFCCCYCRFIERSSLCVSILLFHYFYDCWNFRRIVVKYVKRKRKMCCCFFIQFHWRSIPLIVELMTLSLSPFPIPSDISSITSFICWHYYESLGNIFRFRKKKKKRFSFERSQFLFNSNSFQSKNSIQTGTMFVSI